VTFHSIHEITRQVNEKETKEEAEVWEAQRISNYILMEHAQAGDLFDYSLRLKQPMGEALARYLFV
jgi:predicted DNA binding CopG/RHH family protein